MRIRLSATVPVAEVYISSYTYSGFVQSKEHLAITYAFKIAR